jgi:hypothetical protein
MIYHTLQIRGVPDEDIIWAENAEKEERLPGNSQVKGFSPVWDRR